MSLAMAVRATDGAVVVADRRETLPRYEYRDDARKCWRTDAGVLVGFVGACAHAHQLLREAAAGGALRGIGAAAVAGAIHERCNRPSFPVATFLIVDSSSEIYCVEPCSDGPDRWPIPVAVYQPWQAAGWEKAWAAMAMTGYQSDTAAVAEAAARVIAAVTLTAQHSLVVSPTFDLIVTRRDGNPWQASDHQEAEHRAARIMGRLSTVDPDEWRKQV